MRALKNKNGWITVASAFILQALSHGLGSSMGVFYIQWEKAFPSSSVLISALATSVLATILFTAPISGAISRKFGIRKAVGVGGGLSFAGFVLTCLVYKASILFLTVAVMIGFGCSVLFMASVVAVSSHFTKNYTTASAISNAGASAGVLVLPMLFEILVSTYGWRGASLVVSAIQLHAFVCMMLMKPPSKPSKPESTPVTDTAKNGELHGARSRTVAGTKTTTEEEATSTHEKTGADSETRRSNGRERESQSTDEILTSIDVSDGVDSLSSKSTGDEDMRNDGNDVRSETKNDDDHLKRKCIMNTNESENKISGRTVDSHEVSYVILASQEAGDPSSERTSQTAKQDDHSQLSMMNICLTSCLSVLDLFDVRLLWTNPPFATFMLSFSLGGWFGGTIIPHLAARAVSVGISELLASSLLSIMGAGNLVSRFMYGRLVDSGIIHPVHLLFVAFATTALSSAIVAFSTVYSLLCIGALGIGIGVGIYIPLTQPLVRSLVGHEGFAGAIGLCLMSVGVGNILSATFAGMIYDLTGNYTYVFLLPAGIGALACFTVLVNQMVWGNWLKHPRWPTRIRSKVDTKTSPDEDGEKLD